MEGSDAQSNDIASSWEISVITLGCECLSQSQPHAGAVIA